MLSDLTVFSEFLYTSATEVLAQQLALFNEASGNCMILTTRPRVGDFADTISFAKVPGGLVRRRDAYGAGALASKKMTHLDEVMVKVAAGTPPVELNPSQWSYIQRAPEEAAAAMAQQLAVDTLADMVNTAVGCLVTAMSNASASAMVLDITANTGSSTGGVSGQPYPNNRISPLRLNDAAANMGDRASGIACWLMHSAPMHQLYGNALSNNSGLFNYGTVNVTQDGFGRRYIMSDVPALAVSGANGQYTYKTLGLKPGAVTIEQQGDFIDNLDTRNGNENISRTYQAEWTYEVGVGGFGWNKSAKSPQDAALFTSANWTRVVTQDKELPAVMLLSSRNAA